MADIIDNANDLVEAQQADAFKRYKSKQQDPGLLLFDGTHCVYCEEPVQPKERADLGYCRCFGCQEDYERLTR